MTEDMLQASENEPGSHSKRTRFLHRINEWSERASTAVIVALACFVYLIFGVFVHFERVWIDGLEIVGTSVTLVMVFVIQHTHARQQAALQLKLDEIVRALPSANNELIHVEGAPEAELEERKVRHSSLREDVVGQADLSVEKQATASNENE